MTEKLIPKRQRGTLVIMSTKAAWNEGYNQAIDDLCELWFKRAYHHRQWYRMMKALRKKVDEAKAEASLDR